MGFSFTPQRFPGKMEARAPPPRGHESFLGMALCNKQLLGRERFCTPLAGLLWANLRACCPYTSCRQPHDWDHAVTRLLPNTNLGVHRFFYRPSIRRRVIRFAGTTVLSKPVYLQ